MKTILVLTQAQYILGARAILPVGETVLAGDHTANFRNSHDDSLVSNGTLTILIEEDVAVEPVVESKLDEIVQVVPKVEETVPVPADLVEPVVITDEEPVKSEEA